MTSELPTLLLTSCVVISDQSVSLKDSNSRIRLTIESIEKWLHISANLNIVICDGSNYDFSKIIQEKFPNAHIECLFFQNSTRLVELHGKGYGEGEIINHALLHSKFLNQSSYFAKCTGKLWVENFHECLQLWNGEFLCKGYFSNVFSFKKAEFDYIDTRFYLSTKSFYLMNLGSVHLNINEKSGHSLEHCFRDAIINNKLKNVLFNVPAVICGMGGGSGTYYKNSLKRKIKEVFRLWMVKKNNSFQHLF